LNVHRVISGKNLQVDLTARIVGATAAIAKLPKGITAAENRGKKI
jgi:hypothetical protein